MDNIGTGGNWGPIAGFGFHGRKLIWPSVASLMVPMVVLVGGCGAAGDGDHGKQLDDGRRQAPPGEGQGWSF